MARGLLDNFRKPDFNVAAFVRDAGAHGDTSRLSQQLQDAAVTLEEDLRREIAACHEELLLCASSINDLDGQLGEAHDIVGALKASVSRVRGDVLVPFQEIKWKVELLERMQAVNVLIRRVVRFLWDARKLRSQMDAPGKDHSKAAHTLHELEMLLQETGLDKAGWRKLCSLKTNLPINERIFEGIPGQWGNQRFVTRCYQMAMDRDRERERQSESESEITKQSRVKSCQINRLPAQSQIFQQLQVDILRAEVLWIRDVSAKIRRQSEEDLRTGVRQGNHIGLSVALQAWLPPFLRLKRGVVTQERSRHLTTCHIIRHI